MLHQFTTGEYRYIPYASADDKKHPDGGGAGDWSRMPWHKGTVVYPPLFLTMARDHGCC